MRALFSFVVLAAIAAPAHSQVNANLARSMVEQRAGLTRFDIASKIQELKKRATKLVAVRPWQKEEWQDLERRLSRWQSHFKSPQAIALGRVQADLEFVEKNVAKAEAGEDLSGFNKNRTTIGIVTDISHKYSRAAGYEESYAKAGDFDKAMAFSDLKDTLSGWLKDIGSSEKGFMESISANLQQVDGKIEAIKKS